MAGLQGRRPISQVPSPELGKVQHTRNRLQVLIHFMSFRFIRVGIVVLPAVEQISLVG